MSHLKYKRTMHNDSHGGDTIATWYFRGVLILWGVLSLVILACR